MNKTEKAILQTLAFFNIFSRPLTLEEIWHFLYKNKASKLQVLLGLEKLQKKEIILQKNDYYFLNNYVLETFQKNQIFQQKRWQKVDWVVKILKYAPFVKNISVINSLSFSASNQESDIDILLITKKNRLWTARAFVIGLLELIGQNKNKWYKANKFCLGFAFDEERLELESLRLNPPAGGDIYFSYWLANLKPVLDRNLYSDLIKENSWLSDDLPNWQPHELENTKDKIPFLEKILSGRIGKRLENWFGNIQIKRVWTDPKHLKAQNGLVIANSHMLKMHPNDRREEYQKAWEAKVKTLTQKR